MHEYAITRYLLDQVLAAAQYPGATKITRINLLVGEEAGVVPDCVRFYFDQMKLGTAAAGAELAFKRSQLILRCPKCGAEFSRLDNICSCNAGADVLSGQELTIESIEVEFPPD
ncbi:MAG: hydrogenase maturation nickel metallochaperone HypA [candidate division WOR-3 bacterium]